MNVYFHSDKLAGKADAGAKNRSTLIHRWMRALSTPFARFMTRRYPLTSTILGSSTTSNRDDGTVEVDMTLTAPGCPVAQRFWNRRRRRPASRWCKRTHVELVWEPPGQLRISDEAKLASASSKPYPTTSLKDPRTCLTG